MAGELPGGGELAELVADHILGHIDRHMLAAVVNGEGVADELREDGGGAAPGLDDALLAALVHGFDFLHQRRQDVRAFFGAARHSTLPPLTFGALDDELVGASMVFAGLEAQGRLAPRSARAGMTDRGAAFAAAVRVI